MPHAHAPRIPHRHEYAATLHPPFSFHGQHPHCLAQPGQRHRCAAARQPRHPRARSRRGRPAPGHARPQSPGAAGQTPGVAAVAAAISQRLDLRDAGGRRGHRRAGALAGHGRAAGGGGDQCADWLFARRQGRVLARCHPAHAVAAGHGAARRRAGGGGCPNPGAGRCGAAGLGRQGARRSAHPARQGPAGQ